MAGKVDATIIMVSRENGGYRLTRFERDWRSSSRVVPFDRLEQAVQQVVSQSSGQAYTPDDPEDETRYTPSLPVWRVAVGVSLLAAGVGLSIAAAATHLLRDNKGVLYIAAFPGDRNFLTRQRSWQTAGNVVIGLAMTGGALGAASVAAWMPNRKGVHWASWLVGGLGLAGGAAAFAMMASRPGCENAASDMEDVRRDCVERGRRGGIAAMIGGASLMLFAVPIIDALQSNPSSSESVSLQLAPHAGRQGAGLTLRGEF